MKEHSQPLCMPKLSVVIEAGGKSSRMGQPKALMSFMGIPLIQRVIHIVQPIADEILVVTNEPSEFLLLDIPIVTDSLPGKGAIGGLFTAMDKAGNDYVAVIACDLPFVNPSILTEGLRLLVEANADVAIPKSVNDYYEPFHAVYKRASCKAAILEAINKEQKKLISWLHLVKVHELNEEFCFQLDPKGLAFLNLNTKEDFQKAEEFAKLMQ